MKVRIILNYFCRNRFIERSEAETNHRQAGYEAIVKDKALVKKNVTGEYSCTKIQNVSYDKVFSEYMFYSEVSSFVPVSWEIFSKTCYLSQTIFAACVPQF